MVRGIVASRVPQPELVDAVRPDLHRTHIALLAQSRSGEVREAVARRDDVPFGVQAALSNDDHHGVRAAIAANPRAAVAVMHLLAVDSHHAVLLALASNPSAPREVAERLASHRRADIRNAAIRRLEARDVVPSTLAADPDSRIPELRDRVASAHEADARQTFTEIFDESGLSFASSMTRLAQHVGTRQVQVGSAVRTMTTAGARGLAAS